MCTDARNLLAQQGYLISPPPDLLSLPGLMGHAFPGRHPPHSPPPPPPASRPSLPDLVLPVPAPLSPIHSSTTGSIAPVPNVVNALQDTLIPTRPTTLLPQLPQPRCPRRLCRQRPEPVLLIPLGRTPRVPHTGQGKTLISTSDKSPDGRNEDAALVFNVVMHVKDMAIALSIVVTILALRAG
ncbi:hypothetical protein SERLADRAFT_434132 [Serpula lacrymans var. lacrymans S7.9]|nr:uncharacterized protein SERLADRAFT_434132 [Serpula lacrymans var. lacrymans S7.9]EGO28249.1 hypothetical protein SERLADRAFT_434132 [Serpula lacrymans var. lacrymans S7.9]